ncbi:hypothetical protein JTE90_009532 [Oedothorax gibbosus]|uniref:VWFC domain-containing protein n=1 Tax=Oedothorax gibbosus TaxID=931172 RepID=A0AAV6UUY8_9ARAC|nr:hypothetical protein JTE90_009532 [Oedothorax gibbosus]
MLRNTNVLFISWICISFCITISLGSCVYETKNYMEGDRWNSSCNVCQCQLQTVSCTKMACPALGCSNSELLPGNCCPQCVSPKKSCYEDSTIYAHNDIWKGFSNCTLRRCLDGAIVPFVVQCQPDVCPKGEKLSSIPGKCCPRCIPDRTIGNTELVSNTSDEYKRHEVDAPKQDCITVPGLKEKLDYHVKDFCTICIVDGDEQNCYVPKCPLCNEGGNFYGLSSCCSCSTSSCAEECNKCSDADPNVCLDCKDISNVLHNGKCTAKCPDGFFPNENNHCESCSITCKTCFGNMSSQCSGCKEGYLLQKGQCVKNCDENFYLSRKYCLECHESCLTCEGPNANDCISCSLSGQFLQDGKCVDSCIGHFYVVDNVCLACNESCFKCLKDGSCQYCEDGLYLEEEECVPECTGGYYNFIDAYCLPCHEECQTCTGPLSFQCTSCPFGQFLLDNSCVWDCGQGYFGDLGAGICRTCHPDCRTCLGGSSNDKCLTCTSGYLLPYVGTHFGPCVENCPKKHYLTNTGICAFCHADCETCFGPDETECTSCTGSLYLKNGACIPHCSNGYFQENGICYACHPSCATCSGFDLDQCYTCPFGRTLKHGKCVTSCDEGKYMNSESVCTDCHFSCADCKLNSTESEITQCLKCKNTQHSILQDQCVSQCPPNFYMDSYKICQECHPTCSTCERNLATSCVSCRNGYFLTHLGTCQTDCHLGYCPSNGICETCDADCHHCASKTKCLQCKGDLVLESGQCNPQCTDQHYVDGISRKCTECSMECKTCHGPSAEDCTSCFSGKIFEGGTCVEDCSDGFFLNGTTCEKCDLKCKTCSTLNKCTSCDIPFLLRDGKCVDDCGSQYFADFEDLECKPCGLGCRYCPSAEKCDLCSKGLYLFQEACLGQCPESFYGDPLSRICKVDLGAPTVSISNNLFLEVGHSTLMPPSLLGFSNAEAAEKIFVLLYGLPQNIELIRMSHTGEEKPLITGSNFTSRELQDGHIFLKNSERKAPQGNLLLKVSDGHLSSEEISLPFQATSKYAPTFKEPDYIVMHEDSLFVINSSILQIEDRDNIADVTLNVIQEPCSGKLLLIPGEQEIFSISYDQVSQNMLAFRSLKSDIIQEENLVLQAFDGFNSQIADMKVIIIPKTTEDLFIVHNKPLYINSGIASALSNEYLLAVGDNIQPEDIEYRIDTAQNPSIGNFFKKTSSNNLTEFIENPIKFTQKDIDSQIIFYEHPANSTILSILMMVTNKKSTNKYETKLDFEIHDIKTKFLPPFENNQFGIMVLQNHPASITNDHLLVQINDVSSNDIVYMIAKKLLKEEGILENLDQPGLMLQSFTQSDINNLKIVYHPPPYAGSSEKQFLFQFVVIETKSGSQLSPVQNFTITITPPSSEFTSPASSIDHESIILVTQGLSVDLGQNWLSTIGHEVPDDQLEVEITTAPRHGILVQKIGSTRTEIYEGDALSFTSIINDMHYEHDGSNNLHDSAIFSIMGGRHSSLNRVKFEISPNDRESPVILDSTTLMGSVVEGNALTLQRHHLAFTDLISGDSDISFTLLGLPKYGNLEMLQNGLYNLLRPKDKFTQQDINDLLIRYSANTSIGDDTVGDFLYFDVSDASGNVQYNQVLTMKVKPKIKEPPVLKIVGDVQVNEGGDTVVQPSILTVFDPDTPLSELMIMIERQPAFGFIENARPIVGAETSMIRLPVSSFPYVDLVEGYIQYIMTGNRGLEPEQDTMYIYVDDGHLNSDTHRVNITIRPVNDETPHIFTDSLFVPVGGYAKILNSTLAVVDGDTTAEHITVTFDSLPHRGILKKLANPLNFRSSQTITTQDSLTFQDILDELILYMQGDVKSLGNDSFGVVISDGHHSVSETVNVVIVASDREVPFLLRNLGLELSPGNSSIIHNTTLYASDSDSPDSQLVYTLTSDPTAGRLLLFQSGNYQPMSHKSMFSRFTQDDINQNFLSYQHNVTEAAGLHFFKFTVSDPANNTLLDQAFYITISDDLFPPVITRNLGIKVNRNSQACITSQMLSATEEHHKNLDLIFTIKSQTKFGHLAYNSSVTTPISMFYMSDLKSGTVCYFHTSSNPVTLDNFTFELSDGKNSVLQTFYIKITSIYDFLPTVKIYSFQLKEGTRKVITEFELDVSDKDTDDKNVTIKIVKHPEHGTLIDSSNIKIENFTVLDIKTNNVYYSHDGSESSVDQFTITVSDGSNAKFIWISSHANTTTDQPITFPIKIIQVDDLPPKLTTNKVISGLRLIGGKRMNAITNNILYTEDLDTTPENILYSITVHPRIGFLQLSTSDVNKISNFTQKDINDGKVQYILNRDNLVSTEDTFIFTVQDTKPTKIFNNMFKIVWNRLNLNYSYINVSETSGILEVPIIRVGNALDKKDVASCKIVSVKPKGSQDRFIPIINKVLFDANETLKHCIFKIHDDFEFHGRSQFKILLQSESLLGLPHTALLNVFDEEDEPLISFKQNAYRVNETGNYFNFPVVRKGDLRHELSFLCTTDNDTAQGSSNFGLKTGLDFIGHGMGYKSLVTFPAGVAETNCSVKIIDDNIFEPEEKFLLRLSNPHPHGKLHGNTTAVVIINGPNDVPQVYLGKEHYKFQNSQLRLLVSIIREGVDLSKDCAVTCNANISATSTVFSTNQVMFKPFLTASVCEFYFHSDSILTTDKVKVDVFLDASVGCWISEPNHITYPIIVKINPVVEFSSTLFTVKEDATFVRIPISRTQNLNWNSTIYCITHDGSAKSREDFEERYLSRKTSRVTFSPKQKEAFCTIKIYDDEKHEGIETFQVELVPHKSDEETKIGEKRLASVEIKDPEDATVIQLDEEEFTVSHNLSPDNISISIAVPVLRLGDARKMSKIRVSTIDGSATSGMDYYPKSQVINFSPGERKKNFEIEILYNKQRNWAVTFTVILGPDDVLNANIGNISKAIVRIASVLNTESLILPSVPIVVSLLHFGNISRGMIENPKPGYPLVCITPCDPNYPEYANTQWLCLVSGINANSMHYSWEIALPLNKENLSPFVTISHSTLFTSAHSKILDSIYFRPHERIRCVVQPKDDKGNLGIPLRSKEVKISTEKEWTFTTDFHILPP